MLLRGLSMLILFQLLGTAINVLFLPMLPGPILGFVLMFVYLLLRGGVSENINLASSSLLKYLPLLLTPPAVGIMAHTDAVMADFWAVFGSLVISVLVSVVVIGLLMQFLIRRQQQKQEQSHDA
ncbi:murein hydrolase transporter LrgA [Thiopseudomonas alkaliphila]|uniref:CidA/LrgA family protein n=1 Tax=Thiopseudomonas alkaliphila TaxID=1697053 RepID=UPI00069E8121|nr:CidA/LrgA family protein [Thiopseudomonas alkaliphila]AKX55148.1 murein hydrolase transporter LrgA [Thiopseudomonas alkaliphila]